MKLSRFVCRNAGVSCLMLAVLVNSASGKPGACTATCTLPICGSNGSGSKTAGPCWVQVTETGTGASAVAQVQDVCVDPGTDIYWYTSEPNSYFTIVFGNPHPFVNIPPKAQATFQGKKGQPSGDTIFDLSIAAGCYQYSAQHCKNGACTNVLDPKVIVTSSGGTPPNPPDKK
jgi:hypothetical protein